MSNTEGASAGVAADIVADPHLGYTQGHQRISRPPSMVDSIDIDLISSDEVSEIQDEEKKKRRKAKIKAKIKEKAEKKAQKLLKKRLKEEQDKLPPYSYHQVPHTYDSSPHYSTTHYQSVNLGGAPHFDGKDYPKWAYDMKLHLYGLHPSVWEIVHVGVVLPMDGVITAELSQDLYRNAQATRVITGRLCAQEYNKIRGVQVAKDVWDTLKISHEGTDQVREGRMDLIHGELESFVMLKDETVQQMYERLMILVTDIRGLGSKDWSDLRVSKKFLRAFTPRNQTLATMIRRDPLYKTYTPIQLLSQIVHQDLVDKDVAKSLGLSTSNGIALNASSSARIESCEKPSKSKKKSDSSEDDSTDEETALMVRNFKKFMKKKYGRRGGDDKKGTSQRRCYECKQVGHYIADCPNNKNKGDSREEKKIKDKDEKRYKDKSKEYKNKYQGRACWSKVVRCCLPEGNRRCSRPPAPCCR